MGPLEGVKIIELAGIGPCPMCGMLLAELGADVLKIDRIRPSGLGVGVPDAHAFLHRSRRSIALDLKRDEAAPLVLRLCEQADALIEGFRPGVTERLGIGPEPCLARNARLVYGRVTGWGQTGPLAQAAGHDLDYIALTGALHAIGQQGHPPTPPLNLGRRFRRRRAVSGARCGRGAVRSAAFGARTGRGCGDGRRGGLVDDRLLRLAQRRLD